jgi:hypothetical protein
MAITITSSQAFTATVAAVDAKGNPATIDGAPVWTSSDPSLLLVTTGADPMTVDCAAVGPAGVAQLLVEADADLGDGVRTLTGILDVTIIAGEAASLSIATSAPREQ